MKIFRRDLPGLLERERAALAGAQTKAAELQQQRNLLLLEVDGFDRIWKLDREIAELNSRAAIHQQRLEALRGEVRDQDRE
jgi:hypothetical protein